MGQDTKSVRAIAPVSETAADEPRVVSVPPPLPQRVRGASPREQVAHEQASREQSSREPSSREPSPRDQSSREQSAREPAPRQKVGQPTDQLTTDDPSGTEPVNDLARRKAQRRPAGPSRGRIAANDDAPSIGGLIYALNQKPSNKPYVIAAGASGVWAAACVSFVWMLIGPDLVSGKGFSELFSRTNILPGIATLFGPIGLIWFLALIAWRADELKLRSTAMTEVAVRLAEPDRMAEQSVASLGQAVRRQVSFMNDAVGRALGRAGELEALVHNEVTALERSYEDNERRIRSLIQELAGERNALVTTSDRVSETLRSLGSEVPGLIDQLATQQVKLARIIEGAGQNLTQLESSMASQTGQLENALGSRTEHLQAVLENYTTALGGALGNRTNQMEQMFSGYMASIDNTIGGRTEVLQGVFEEYARSLDTTLANRAQALDMQLVERTKTLDNAFSERLRLFDESILRSTMAIDGAVGEKANALTSAMEHHARNMSQTIGKQAVELDETLMHGINAVRRTSENITKQSIKAIEGLASQSDLLKNVSENLLGQINSVTNRFENQGQTIMKAANALESANYKIDVTLQNRQVELSTTLDRMSGKAEDLSRFMQGYSSTLEGSLSEAENRTRLLTDEMARGVEERSRSTIADIERLKHDASLETDRALEDLRAKFSNVSQEVTQRLGSMTEQFTVSSGEMRSKAAAAASEFEAEQAHMRAQLQSMPTTTKESADAMRRALGDQLRALEQLSSLTNREASRRDIAPPVEAPTPGPSSLATSGYPLPGRDGGRYLSTLGNSLAQELGQRGQARSAASGMPPMAPPLNVPPPGDARSSSWSLGDLLARASHDEDGGSHARLRAPASQPAMQGARTGPGVGLNVEVISRALDAATASAIWSRYRAGQRGVMVRSIYTAEGRAAFDEVTRRYRDEIEFQHTVNRYLGDYERILGESDRRDPSGRLTQSQLISDTGRVYLFLAHVSGRLN